MGSRKKSARSEEGGSARILFSHGLKFGSNTQLAEPCREGLAHHAIRFQNIFPPCGDGSRSNDTVGQVAVVQDRLAAGSAALRAGRAQGRLLGSAEQETPGDRGHQGRSGLQRRTGWRAAWVSSGFETRGVWGAWGKRSGGSC